jgi:hypothetical protein
LLSVKINLEEANNKLKYKKEQGQSELKLKMIDHYQYTMLNNNYIFKL